MTEIKTLWLVDFNGTYALPTKTLIPAIARKATGGAPLTEADYQLLTRPVPEIEAWKTLRPINLENERVKYRPNEILSALNKFPGLSLPERPFLPPIAQWTRLREHLGYDPEALYRINAYYEEKNKAFAARTRGERALRWYRRNDDNIYWVRRFKITHEEEQALITRKAAGDEFVFATGLVEHSESDFINHLGKTRTWKAIRDGNPPGFIRVAETLEDPNLIFYKCMVYVLMDQVVKARNAEYKAKGIDTQVVLKGIDDHYGFIRTIEALLDNIELHMPLSEREAQRQPHIALPPSLAHKTPNSHTKFDSGLALAA